MKRKRVSYYKFSEDMFKCTKPSTRALWRRIRNIIDEENNKKKSGKSILNLC